MEIVCICCRTNINPTFDFDSVDVDNVDHLSFTDGMAGKISAGYGSILDGNVYVIGVCDTCIAEAVVDHRLHYVKNYLLGDRVNDSGDTY